MYCYKKTKNGDDIKHCVRLVCNIDGSDQYLNLDGFNFSAKYYIDGFPEKYEAFKNGDTFSNCVLSSDKKTIKFTIENYSLQNGYLHCSLDVGMPDLDFSDSFFNISKGIDMGFELCDSNEISIYNSNRKDSIIRIDYNKEVSFLNLNDSFLFINNNLNSIKL